jgi:sulfatase maturation enzyme AslB (radical SAM superfamily)
MNNDDHAQNREETSAKFQWSFLVTRFKEGTDWVIYHWGTTQNAIINDPDHPVYKLLEDKTETFALDLGKISPDEASFLFDNGFLVDNQQNVIEYVEERYCAANSSSKLELILMIANQACNFSCVYCYEDHNQKHRMGDIEIHAILKFIERRQPDDLAIDYFGGEPLLNHKFITKFNQQVVELSDRKFGFTSSIVTNGYLLTIDLFLELLA